MDETERNLRDAFAVGVGRTVHPRATGMLQVDRSIELFGVSTGSVGFRSPATAMGPIYTLPASDSSDGTAVLTTDGASNLYWTPLSAIAGTETVTTIGASLGLVGSTLSVNERTWTWLPFACTLTEAVMFASPSGSVTVGVWATGFSAWPPTGNNVITTVSISSGVATKLALSSLAVASDVGIMFNVNSITSTQQLTLVLKAIKSATTSGSGSQGAGGDYGRGLVHPATGSGGRPSGGDYGGPYVCDAP